MIHGVEPARGGPVIVDIGWRESARHGSDIVRADPRTGTVTLLAQIVWDPAHTDGWRRFAWTVTSPPGALITRLLVVASPEAQVEPVPPLTAGAGDVQVAILRVQSASVVPQLGEPVRVGSLLPPRSPITVATASPSSADLALSRPSSPGAARPPLVEEASVRWLPDGAEVRHERGHWSVRITVDPRAAHGFGLRLDAAPARGAYALASSAFTLRIATRGDVRVEASELSTRAPLLPDGGLSPRVRGSHVDVSVGVDDGRDPLPLTGVDLDRARRYREVRATPLPTALESLTFNLPVQLAVLTLSVLPGSAGVVAAVVLVVYELGNLGAAVAYGHDLLGNPVPEENLPVLAAFALLSTFTTAVQVVGGARRAADAAMRARLAALPGTTVTTGFDTIREHLDRFCSPLVREAVLRLDRQAAERVLVALESAMASGDPALVRRLSAVLTAELTPLLTSVQRTSGIPAALYVEAMTSVHVADTAAFAALTPPQRLAAIRAYGHAREAADPSALQLGTISADLDTEYTEAIRDAVLQRVFGPGLDGFRVPLLQPAMLAGTIESGHAAYTAGKLTAGRSPSALLEWAGRQPRSGRYRALLEAELGPDYYEHVLKPVIDSRRYDVDSAAAAFLRTHHDVVDDYDTGRELVSKANLGRLIQLDHIVEQRILRYWDEVLPELENAGTFSAALVPANQFAATNFRRAGVTEFLYVHTHKTDLMQRWVPNGMEDKFTVQELFDAYRLVFTHELGFDDDTFRKLVEADFAHLWDLVRSHADDLLADGEQLTHPRHADAWAAPLDVRPRTRAELVASALRPLSR